MECLFAENRGQTNPFVSSASCAEDLSIIFFGGQTKFRSILASTSWVKGRKHIDYKQLLNVNARELLVQRTAAQSASASFHGKFGC